MKRITALVLLAATAVLGSGCASQCGPASCAGCCDSSGRCQTGTTSGACGTPGGVCVSCPGATSCQDGICKSQAADAGQNDAGMTDAGSCGPGNCSGCCEGATCISVASQTTACGLGGAACQDCSAGDASCQAGSCVQGCGPSTCASGCCQGIDCVSPGNTLTACGSGGAACQVCAGAGASCAASSCQCSGCLDSQGVCQLGQSHGACGLGGVACVACSGNQSCNSQGTCVGPYQCSAQNCSTCCDGNVCLSTGTSCPGAAACIAGVCVGSRSFVFVTSGSYPGDLKTAGGGIDPVDGGLEGADQLCNAAAQDAGLPGNYVAWLSSDTVDAIDRLGGSGPWYQPTADGGYLLTFDGKAGLSDPAVGLLYDERGLSLPAGEAWTGSLSGGAMTAATCAGFTTSSSNYNGVFGTLNNTLYWSSNASVEPCSISLHLYCFEQ